MREAGALAGRFLEALKPPILPAERAGFLWALAAFLGIEFAIGFLCYWFGAGIGLLAVGGLLYAALCWYSLPAAWLVCLAAVPFSQEIVFPAVQSALWIPTEPMLFVFLGVWFLRSFQRREILLRSSPLVTSLAILWAVAVLSMIQSDYLTLSAKAIASTTWLVLFAFLYPYQSQDFDGLLRKAPWLLVLAGVFLSAYGLVYLADHGVSRPSGSAMGRPFFPEHGTYSTYLGFGLSIALGMALLGRSRIMRFMGTTAFAVGLLAIVLSLTRAAYLGIAGILAVFAFYLVRRRTVLPLLAVVGALGIFAFAFGQFETGRYVGQYVQSIADPGELSNLGRINRWLAAGNMVRKHPLLGVGHGAYPEAYYSHRVMTFRSEDRFIRTGAHSEYLTVISEMGWIGFAAQLFFFAMLARVAHRVILSPVVAEHRWLALGAFGGIVSYLIHGLFNNYSGSDKMTLPFWLLVAILAALGNRVSESRTHLAPAP